MKILLFAASAAALGTAAMATEPTAVDDPKAMPDSAETTIYDGPDSYTPSQPPPAGSEGQVLAQRLDTYQPMARDSYPVCSTEIRDNCVQRNDPGGSDVELAAQGSTGINAPGTSYTGMGGPEVEADADMDATVSPDPAVEPALKEEPGDTLEPEPETDY